jgi:hypothetical protein
MPNEILYSVSKDAVVIQDKRMHRLLAEANSTDERSTYRALNDAYRALNIARGFYEALNGLGLLEIQNLVGEDIERIEKKINDILDSKRRRDTLKWRSP